MIPDEMIWYGYRSYMCLKFRQQKLSNVIQENATKEQDLSQQQMLKIT